MPNEQEREEVLRIHLNKRGHDPEAIDGLDKAVTDSAGYVPAEIESAVKDALIASFTGGVPVTGELIAEQLGDMTPLAVAFADDFRAMAEWAQNNARPANVGEPVALPQRGVRQRSATPISDGNSTARDMGLDG